MSRRGHSDDQLGPGKVICFDKTYEKYTLLKKLSSVSSQIIVYKAEFHLPEEATSSSEPPLSDCTSQANNNNNYVVLKMIPLSLRDECLNLRLECTRSCRPDRHNNVYGVKGWFNIDGYVGVSMPYMDEGSLRHIISSRFNNGGLPEDCIAVALREALLGLSFLHSRRRVHNHFSATNIFVDSTSSIKLAFEASMYEHDPDEINQHHGPRGSSTSAPDLKEITKWAAAPEVYGREDSGVRRVAYEQKADIWLVGITALELAYGCLPVADRQDLRAIINKITKNQNLPSFEKLKEITEKAGMKISKGKKLKMYLQKKVKLALRIKKTASASGSKQKEEEEEDDDDDERGKRVFSKDFEEMVAKCLTEKPEKRPTVDELLQTNFIRNSKDINHFMGIVLSANDEITEEAGRN